MPSLLVTGFKTEAEVEAFIGWYSGQGEQNSDVWFECRVSDGEIDTRAMMVDCKETFPVKFDKDHQAEMKLKMIK